MLFSGHKINTSTVSCKQSKQTAQSDDRALRIELYIFFGNMPRDILTPIVFCNVFDSVEQKLRGLILKTPLNALDLRPYHKNISDDQLLHILRRYSVSLLSSLQLGGCFHITSRGIEYISHYAKNLHSLGLQCCSLGNQSGFRELTRLNSYVCRISSSHSVYPD